MIELEPLSYTLYCEAVFGTFPHIALVASSNTCTLYEDDTLFGDEITASIIQIEHTGHNTFTLEVSIDIEAESAEEAARIIYGIIGSDDAYVKINYENSDVFLEAAITNYNNEY